MQSSSSTFSDILKRDSEYAIFFGSVESISFPHLFSQLASEDGKLASKQRSFSGTVFCRYIASMSLDNRSCDCQPYSHAVGLGTKKEIENAREPLNRNSGTSIRNGELDSLTLDGVGPNGEPARTGRVRHRFHAIKNQI